MKKNVASQSIGAEMITAADGTAFTGAVTVLITIDNGTQTASGGTAPAHEGNGYHSYTPTQAETNGDHIAFTWTGTGAIPATVQLFTNFPQTVDNDTKISLIPTTPMRGTDSAATAANLATVDSNVDAILVDTGTTIPAQITGLNDFNPATDTVANVTTVATTTTNTDMVGTDNALLAASYTAPDNAGITANGVAISALNDISVAQIFAGGDIDGFNLEESQKLILAASAGTLSGAATTTVTITAVDGSKARLTATVDGDGNRAAVIKDATG